MASSTVPQISNNLCRRVITKTARISGAIPASFKTPELLFIRLSRTMSAFKKAPAINSTPEKSITRFFVSFNPSRFSQKSTHCRASSSFLAVIRATVTPFCVSALKVFPSIMVVAGCASAGRCSSPTCCCTPCSVSPSRMATGATYLVSVTRLGASASGSKASSPGSLIPCILLIENG